MQVTYFLVDVIQLGDGCKTNILIELGSLSKDVIIYQDLYYLVQLVEEQALGLELFFMNVCKLITQKHLEWE